MRVTGAGAQGHDQIARRSAPRVVINRHGHRIGSGAVYASDRSINAYVAPKALQLPKGKAQWTLTLVDVRELHTLSFP